MDFVGFLSMVIYVVSLLYTQCLMYNICSIWFLDIRITTCYQYQITFRFWVHFWYTKVLLLDVSFNFGIDILQLIFNLKCIIAKDCIMNFKIVLL